MNQFPKQNKSPDIETLLKRLHGKSQDEWAIEDWKIWAEFCDQSTDYFEREALRLLKENLQREVQYKSLEDWTRKKLGLPKNRKIKGLLARPRGRPINYDLKRRQREIVATLRNQGKSWEEISNQSSELGIGITDIREIRRLIKPRN